MERSRGRAANRRRSRADAARRQAPGFRGSLLVFRPPHLLLTVGGLRADTLTVEGDCIKYKGHHLFLSRAASPTVQISNAAGSPEDGGFIFPQGLE
jgi:hypothetical protein